MSLTINLSTISRSAANLISPRGKLPRVGNTPAGKTVTWHPRAGDLAQHRANGSGQFVSSLGKAARDYHTALASLAPPRSWTAPYDPTIPFSMNPPKQKDSSSRLRPEITAGAAALAGSLGQSLVNIDQLGDLSSDQKALAASLLHHIDAAGYFTGVDSNKQSQRAGAAAEAVRTLVAAPSLLYVSSKNPSYALPRVSEETVRRSSSAGWIDWPSNPTSIASKYIDSDESLSAEQKASAKSFAHALIQKYLKDFTGTKVEREDLKLIAEAAARMSKAD
jgi:hypothetical protein